MAPIFANSGITLDLHGALLQFSGVLCTRGSRELTKELSVDRKGPFGPPLIHKSYTFGINRVSGDLVRYQDILRQSYWKNRWNNQIILQC
ncbi:hypothetical protein CPSG_06767 [Coccidioides posadasii str. Silveira]|uniref:Uncharacterized protein n=1 Tax=Coccidioides posadasii (strain RMSCC 757 / Silveira) TaxID=443226 RepID=E9DA77_COCPS|nr:hypothetical protein CPSG_06767 [Coccidioides posadasii str. Silveira]